jgi:hypothetical protein
MDNDFAAMVEEMRSEAEAHAATCEALECVRCDRRPCVDCGVPVTFEVERCAQCGDKARRASLGDRWRRLVPAEHAGAALSAPWLRSLVGEDVIARIVRPLGRVTLLGPAGAGKTSLGVALLREAFAAGRRCVFASAADLGRARSGHPLGQGEAPAVAAALAADVLLVDELGIEAPHYSATLAEVIYERHAARRETLVTSGLGLDALGGRYGGGIQRRLAEGAQVIELRRSPR